MDMRDFICIGCPLGCVVRVKSENGEVLEISGNSCLKGEQYVKKEIINPTRILTTTVIVNGGEIPMVSVKTSKDIPKDKIMDCLLALHGVGVNAPVNIGDVIVENIAGMNVNVIATKNIGVNPRERMYCL